MTRFTNLALGALLAIALLTGLTAQAAGTSWGRIAVVMHGAAAFGIVILARPKTPTMSRGFKRPNSGRWLSVLLVVMAIVTVTTGLLQMSGLTSRVGPLTTMQVHIGAAVSAVALAIAHYRRHPVRPRRRDLSRRTFLRSGGLATLAGVAWVSWEGVVRLADLPGRDRRFTGSHERGSGNPAQMPVSQWLDDNVPRIEREEHRLIVGGATMTMDDLMALPQQTVSATLDCTGGWFSEQEWTGVRLDRIVEGSSAASIKVTSSTGYTRRFPAGDLENLWLATAVGGAPLSAGHGAPVRLVAPGRRGFWGVKWVTEVETSPIPSWLQLPFPLS